MSKQREVGDLAAQFQHPAVDEPMLSSLRLIDLLAFSLLILLTDLRAATPTGACNGFYPRHNIQHTSLRRSSPIDPVVAGPHLPFDAHQRRANKAANNAPRSQVGVLFERS